MTQDGVELQSFSNIFLKIKYLSLKVVIAKNYTALKLIQNFIFDCLFKIYVKSLTENYEH